MEGGRSVGGTRAKNAGIGNVCLNSNQPRFNGCFLLHRPCGWLFFLLIRSDHSEAKYCRMKLSRIVPVKYINMSLILIIQINLDWNRIFLNYFLRF